MRVLIITDSLGCPREETPVEDTWTDIEMVKWTGKGIYFYTECKRGIIAREIGMNRLKLLKPDIVICQIGIVDACRRAFSPRLTDMAERNVPIVSKVVNWFIKNYHYTLSKWRKIHWTTIGDFERTMTHIAGITEKTAFIKIAPPGKNIRNKIYHVEEDVKAYNDIIVKVAKENNAEILDPYKGMRADEICLPDGHHLNSKGIKSVCDAVDLFFERNL